MADEEGGDQSREVQQSSKPGKRGKKGRRASSEGLLKAVVRDGEGDCPGEGDLLVFHCTIRTESGTVCHSSREDQGGKGHPRKAILGKTPLVAALEAGLPTMRPREVAVFKVKPEGHYGDPQGSLEAPEGVPPDELLLFELELLGVHAPARVLAQDGSILKHIVKEGEGWEQPRAPYQVKIHVEARVSGRETYFSTSGEQPLRLTVGQNEVPAGLEQGLASMLRGEVAVIHVSGEQHLAPSGRLPSPPNGAAEAEFEVELVQIIQVRDVLGDGSIIKTRVKDGTGEFPVDCPLEDSVVQVHYRGTLPEEGGREFYNTRTDPALQGDPLRFGTGEALVPEALDMSVRLMVPGEVATVTATSAHAYDKFPRPEGVPEGSRVQWEVELLGFERPKQWDGLSFGEIMEETIAAKELANQVFKRGHFDLARAKYEKLLRELHNVHPHSEEESNTLNKAKVSLQLNISACFQKSEEYVKAIEWANKVLEGDPNHAKGLYRRGVARMFCGDFEEARRDFRMMMKADPSAESDALAWLSRVKKREQEAEAKARRQFKGLFDKHHDEVKVVPPEDTSEQEDLTKDRRGETSGDGTAGPMRGGLISIASHFYGLGKHYLQVMGAHRGQCNLL